MFHINSEWQNTTAQRVFSKIFESLNFFQNKALYGKWGKKRPFSIAFVLEPKHTSTSNFAKIAEKFLSLPPTWAYMRQTDRQADIDSELIDVIKKKNCSVLKL